MLARARLSCIRGTKALMEFHAGAAGNRSGKFFPGTSEAYRVTSDWWGFFCSVCDLRHCTPHML